jgi:hypothetical protein
VIERPLDIRRSQVCDAVLDRLGGMRAGAGYYFDYHVYDGWTPDVPEHPASMLTLGDEVPTERSVGTGLGSDGVLHRELAVLVEAQHRIPDQHELRPRVVADMMITDIQRAVLADHTLGGVAVNVRLDTVAAPEYSPERGTVTVSVGVSFLVTYRTRLKDPTEP